MFKLVRNSAFTVGFALTGIQLLLLSRAATPELHLPEPLPPETPHQVRGMPYGNNARLLEAAELPEDGPGFIHLFDARNRPNDGRRRFYGSDGLVRLIQEVAARMAERFPEGEPLQIGDLSGPRGGKLFGHTSHQNGLDVDLVYFRNNRYVQTAADKASDFFEKFVVYRRKRWPISLNDNIDFQRNWELLKLLQNSGRLKYVFMHRMIKKGLCNYVRSIGEIDSPSRPDSELTIDILSRILTREKNREGLENHDDHMHVRLNCPLESKRSCIEQPNPPFKAACPRG